MHCKASVIIPVYNAEKTLRRCVESLVLGSERNIEVILIDDCSSDHSWELCRELAAEFANVCCIQNMQNSGVSFTRNHGLGFARGKYLLFVDSDDWVSGHYVETMINLAERYPGSLPICGQHFIDKVHHTARDYTWDNRSDAIIEISSQNFFDLIDRFLLQQLWNKIFRRDLIEKQHVRFDERQSMGEDFQFVLDYMEAMHCQKCVVINKPLYYYIRWHQSSLMSKFGLTENENEYRRLHQLLNICGADSDEMRRKYNAALTTLKNNYVYQAMHAKSFRPDEKRKFIEKAMGADVADRIYKEGKMLILKEQIALFISECKAIPGRAANKLQRAKNKLTINMARAKLRVENVTIISQNCIGGVLYHDMGMQFASPTIDLFFSCPDFVRFVQALDYYLRLEPVMSWGEAYPVGKLDDITIHFMHYNTCAEAKSAWQRRKQRVDLGRVLVLSTDMEGFTDQVYEQWRKITYPKILFTADSRYAEDPDILYFPQFKKNRCVPDLIPARLFYRKKKILLLLNNIDKM